MKRSVLGLALASIFTCAMAAAPIQKSADRKPDIIFPGVNEMLLDGECVRVCTGPKIEGFSGKVCPDGRPGLTLDGYEQRIKEGKVR